MRVLWGMIAVLAAQGICCAQTQQRIAPAQLVREVVYNELHDHESHGFWRYWIEHHEQNGRRLENEVETADGPVTRLAGNNGQPLNPAERVREDERLNSLLNSPSQQARHRQEYMDDERRIGRIVALLPDAFVFDFSGEENECLRLRFRPNSDYSAHSIEARIFHSMSGEIWIDMRDKRMARLEGHIEENVDFGFGLLGRLNKGGWFRLQRARASATDWKTEALEVHLSGRAMLFRTIARETSEQRGGFTPVPAGMSLAQGVFLLAHAQTDMASIAPASFSR